jgi:hypothetical protein
MQSIKWEGYKSIEKTVEEILTPDDPVLLQFDVIPLDYRVENTLSPKIFLTRTRLVLVVDSLIEIYNLKEIAIWVIGGKPNFTLTQQALEARLDYESSKTPLSKNTEIPDGFLRFAIMEKNAQQKEFVLRRENFPVKSYQTWAFAQFVRNLQRGYEDYRVYDMIFGSFSIFEGMFLIGAFLIFIVYVLISVLLGGILPDIITRVLDFLFAIVCVGVLGWTFWTIFVNIRRYRKVYEKYNTRGFKSNSIAT